MYKIKNEDIISADLLSSEEASKLPKQIRANCGWWWLQSRGINNRFAVAVNIDGDVNKSGNFIRNGNLVVRPALKILNLPELEIGDLVEIFGLKAQYIGYDRVLLCNSICFSKFDNSSNVYETSEVKKKLDWWFENIRERVE